jgi:hypothetical protein
LVVGSCAHFRLRDIQTQGIVLFEPLAGGILIGKNDKMVDIADWNVRIHVDPHGSHCRFLCARFRLPLCFLSGSAGARIRLALVLARSGKHLMRFGTDVAERATDDLERASTGDVKADWRLVLAILVAVLVLALSLWGTLSASAPALSSAPRSL